MTIENKKNNFNPSYIGIRNDILNIIPNNARKVLDVGCSVGALGEQIIKRNNAEVVGIELDEHMAIIADERLDKVIIGHIEKIKLSDYLAPNYFDCIIFADILEHLNDPWDVLKNATRFLNDSGDIIISIPNVRHYSTIINLLFKGCWPYRTRGIHDRTHLRFFTLQNIKDLLQFANLEIVKMERNYRIIEQPHRINKYSKYFAIPLVKNFITFQYIIAAKKSKKYIP